MGPSRAEERKREEDEGGARGEEGEGAKKEREEEGAGRLRPNTKTY